MRMYFFVPRQLNGLAAGIQAGHAAVDYMATYPMDQNPEVMEWLKEPTFIILNGGTLADLALREEELVEMGVRFATFEEPDLNDSLAAIAFLVPESVYGISQQLQECLDEHTEVTLLNSLPPQDVALWEYLKSFRLASN